MMTMKASEAKLKFGEMIDKAIKEPVIINKYNRSYVVVISIDYYKKLIKTENCYYDDNPIIRHFSD